MSSCPEAKGQLSVSDARVPLKRSNESVEIKRLSQQMMAQGLYDLLLLT